MQIAFLQKLSLLDYPRHLSCIVFTVGCNLACPFCHNADLALSNHSSTISKEEVFNFLKMRQGILEGVCITGGEPLIHSDLEDFIIRIKSLGYKVKLDTNGILFMRLKSLIDKKLLDYVAMDIKNSFDNYNLAVGASIDYDNILKSAKLIMDSGIEYEFRTTVVKELHTLDDIKKIGKEFKGAAAFYLQNFLDSGNIIRDGLSPFSREELNSFLAEIQKYIPNAKIR